MESGKSIERSENNIHKPETEVAGFWKNIEAEATPASEATAEEKIKDYWDQLSADNEVQTAEPEENKNDAQDNVGLTDEEKIKIKEETGWSDEIIDSFENMEQYEICKNADLREVEINGRKCLIRDIDWDYIDPKTLLTNRERVENDLVPIDSKTGEKIELHHLGQKFDGPFVELTENSEHGDGNHKILHPHSEGSWRNTPGNKDQYNNERKDHWKTRSEMEA